MKFQVKREGKLTLLGLGLSILIATAVAAVPGIFSYVNSTNGYKVAGAAGSSGQALCSNGTYYNTPCNVLGSAFYQTVAVGGVGVTQRPLLNFISGTGVTVSCVDNSGSNRTDCTVTNTGTAPAAYITSSVCSGTYPTEACYNVYSNGLKESFGHISVTFPSGTLATGSISYPNTAGNAFTVNPTLTLTANENADGSNNFSVWGNSASTSGINVSVRCSVNIGGSGCSGSLASTVPIAWRAIGQ